MESFASSAICKSLVNPIDLPAISRSSPSGRFIIILVLVFRIAASSTADGDWSTIIKPCPYERISAIEVLIISTDLPITLEPSWLCCLETRGKIQWASSSIVTYLRLSSIVFSPLDERHSVSPNTRSPIRRERVSEEPMWCKSIMALLSKSSL